MKRNYRVCKHFGLKDKIVNWWRESKETRKTGYGLALIVAATDGSFALVNIFAGWLGVNALATYTIIANVNVFVFMIFFAISQATTIVVAHTYGEKQYKKLKFATLSGYVVYMIVAVFLLGTLSMFPEKIYGLFSNDEGVISVVKTVFVFIIIDLIVDTLPINMEASLRGINDIKYLTINQVFSFLFARIATCYLLAFVCEMGLAGLILGLAGGGICSAILNTPRLIADYVRLAKEKY